MGPRSVERGKKAQPENYDHITGASMGPRSVERGKAGAGSVPVAPVTSFNGAAFG